MSTKIHALVEGFGSLVRFRLTGGEAGDSPEAVPLLGDLQPGALSADKAYDTDALIEHLTARQIQAVIPPKKNRLIQRHFDQNLYKNRNLIERFFCRIKHFRRIATRYDKLAQRFASFVEIAASFIWLALLATDPKNLPKQRAWRTLSANTEKVENCLHGRIWMSPSPTIRCAPALVMPPSNNPQPDLSLS